MPNWCWNNLSVDGKREDIKRFLDAITNEDGKYDLTLPYPCPRELQITARFLSEPSEDDDEETKALRKKYEENRAKYGTASWYEWCIDNWGTKWPPNIEDWDFDDDGKHIHLRFDSAWAPPSALIQKLSAEFQTLSFVISYKEGGMCFAGAESYQAGDCVYNGYFEYDSVPEWAKLSETDFDDDESWDKASGIIRDALDQRIDEAESALAKEVSNES